MTWGGAGLRVRRVTDKAEKTAAAARSVTAPSGIWRLPLLRWLREEFLESGPVRPLEKRGYWLWGPLTVFIAVPEILAALSGRLKNAIPWPTISNMTGHLESLKDWVAIIPVALIAMVAYHVVTYPSSRKKAGHAIRRGRPGAAQELPLGGVYVAFVLASATATGFIADTAGAGKYTLGYAIYSSLAAFGVALPSGLAYWRRKILGAPTLFHTIADLQKRLHWVAVVIVAGLVVLLVHLALYPWPKFNHNPGGAGSGARPLSRIEHIVVIYEENHSFDNLYGGWGQAVNGLAKASAAAADHPQIGQNGTPYTCLEQDDVNLASLAADCTDSTTKRTFTSAFPNAPFAIDKYIPPAATTCPRASVAYKEKYKRGVPKGKGLPGGCTRDLVHGFYQAQYQLDGEKQDRFVTGSDALGLAIGYYNTKKLPIWAWLHRAGHPAYAILDNFFQAAFGGSFLNHQWLIAAATPVYRNPPAALKLHSIVDSNGMPTSYPLYKATSRRVHDGPLTVDCPSPVLRLACGDYAVNTMEPESQPSGTHYKVLPLQRAPTIGDELSAAGIDWAWYSGGWSNAAGQVGGPGWTNGTGPKCSDRASRPNPRFPYCPNKLFQFHHQPFNYYENYAEGAPGRVHLRDEEEFIQLAQSSKTSCNLKPVSFVKPLGQENEHPGYASEHLGSDHLVSLLKAIESGKCARDTMVIVTYDEFGGQWDHVPAPGQGGTLGPHDIWGPGPRVPALVISPFLLGDFVVDHTQHDTTSILATIEHRFRLAPLSSRDAAVKDLSSVFAAT